MLLKKIEYKSFTNTISHKILKIKFVNILFFHSYLKYINLKINTHNRDYHSHNRICNRGYIKSHNRDRQDIY